ncbi:MAG: ABC transporter ATP-binding protein [Oscillospiraceae bacterium]
MTDFKDNKEDLQDSKVNLQLWKRLCAYALRHKGFVIFTALILLVVAGIDLVYPQLTRYAINHFITAGQLDGLIPFAFIYIISVLIQGSCVFLFVWGAGHLEMSIAYDIRQDAFTKLQQLSFSFYDTTSVGWLMARMVSDIARLSDMIAWSLVDLMWAGCFAIGIVIILLMMNWKLGLLILCVAPVLAALCMFFQKRILKEQRTVRKTNSRITGGFNEGIMGAATTKTLVREEKSTEEFMELTSTMRRASIRAAVLSAIFMPLVMTLGSISTALALAEGGNLVLKGVLDLGTLTAFISYTTQLFDPIQQLARILAEMQSAQASAERVLDLLDQEPEVADSKEITDIYGDSFVPKKENWPKIDGAVEFRDVGFCYKSGERVLSNFNLKVKPGESIALVGETGAGKSTLVNLVCRFYEPSEGTVLIDDVDYRERSQLWLHSALGYVLQSPHLFSGTIADNISYAKKDATDAEIKAAAEMVHAAEFIERLPGGYQTEVGEGGNRLSTGQKQLISFARVILADPRIFVLDEATSSIDTETEQQIQNAIQAVLKGRTSFIVAHRLSTIRSADKILVMQNGKIAESGTHSELMAMKGYYYELNNQ